jgi:hypothetical protein
MTDGGRRYMPFTRVKTARFGPSPYADPDTTSIFMATSPESPEISTEISTIVENRPVPIAAAEREGQCGSRFGGGR